MADEPAIVRRVRTFFATRRSTAGPIVVAVSGGPDSVALLRAMIAAQIGPLFVAHLNHGLREPAADWDEVFVGDLVTRLQRVTPSLRFRNARRKVATEARGENLEAAARRIRYGWLAEVAQAAGAKMVATGHTANDQAETVLLQLLRGTGLDGLCGIAQRRRLASGADVVRPILNVTRADVLAYLQGLGQEYRVDATNADTTRTRSRIRHELLPHLIEHFNPRIVESLGRLANQAADVRRDQATVVDSFLVIVERPRAGSLLVFDVAALCKLPRRQRRLVWRRVWRRENWPRQGMGYHEWDRLARICSGEPAAIDLPGRIRARRRDTVIQVGPVTQEI
jgi:tRNA(Ile)-lysidine synthase